MLKFQNHTKKGKRIFNYYIDTKKAFFCFYISCAYFCIFHLKIQAKKSQKSKKKGKKKAKKKFFQIQKIYMQKKSK